MEGVMGNSMKKILVTGGAGFIGSHLVRGLLSKGYQVRVLDNFLTGSRKNIYDVAEKIELVEGDLRDFHTVVQAVEGVDAILHQAALPSVPRSVANPITSSDVNISGTLNLFWAAKEEGIKKIVFASSSSVYGDSAELPKHEGMILSPLSPYAVSKVTKEHYAKVFSSLYGMEITGLRYFNVFGPRQDPSSQYSAVIPKFITMMMRGESPTIHGDGLQSRDFTFIDNVVEANINALSTPGIGGLMMNIAGNGQFTLNEIVDKINVILGTEVRPVYGAARAGDIKHSYASVNYAMQSIGYRVSVDLEEGLKQTVRYFAL